MGKGVTALASVFVVAIAIVLVVNSGLLDRIFGEGQADVEYTITNDQLGEVTVTFTDGIEEERTFTLAPGQSEVFSVHYTWSNRMPMTLTAVCDYGSGEQVRTQVAISNGNSYDVAVSIPLLTISNPMYVIGSNVSCFAC